MVRAPRFRRLAALAFFSPLLSSLFAAPLVVTDGEPTPVTAQTAPAIEDLFAPSFLRQPSLSPDGKYLAATATWEDDIGGLFLLDLQNFKTQTIQGNESMDIYRTYWAGSDRLLFNVSRDKLYSLGLYSAPVAKLKRHAPIKLFDAVELVGQPKARPNHALIWVRASALANGAPGALQEINTLQSLDDGGSLSTAKLSSSVARTYPSPEGVPIDYAADIDGELAFVRRLVDGKASYALWDLAKRIWKDPPSGRENLVPLGIDPDRSRAWVVTRDAFAGSQLRRMELATGLLEAPIHEDREFDLDHAKLIFSPLSRELVGLTYERQRAVSRWLSPKFASVQAVLDNSLPKEEDHLIVDFDHAENRFLVKSVGPRQPGVFHLYDASTQRISRIGETAPAMAGKALRPATPVAFKARDGLPLSGYITVPAGASKQTPAPLVVLAHGGPWARDDWAFDAEVQFLVSLGYGVLQPNYRGSSGYLWPEGTNDYEAAFGAMRDDVVDATRTALRSGLFDPSRVVVMGGSFGGYLALACSVEEPELYRCAVSVCGVFDWAEHVKSKRSVGASRPGEYQLLLGRLGDPKRDQETYEALNPLRRLDRLRAPILIAHGKEDSIASIRQSRLLARELKKRKHPHETFFRPLAGHGFFAAKDRLAYYETLRAFLAAQLASSSPSSPAPSF